MPLYDDHPLKLLHGTYKKEDLDWNFGGLLDGLG